MGVAAFVDPDGFVELIRRAPMLAALESGPMDRAELEDRLGISRATSHRFTRWLGERGLIDRTAGEFSLTPVGEAVRDSVEGMKRGVETAVRLGPILDATDDGVPPPPLEAFETATVTSTDRGDPHAPMVRFIELVRSTATLHGFDTWAIAPTYMEEFQGRIIDGMETTLIDPRPVVQDIMEHYPERCMEVCSSGNLTIRVHDSLPFGLTIFDDRIGIAVRDAETNRLTAFVDTGEPAAREWAALVYRKYEAESAILETFTERGLRDAIADA